MTDTSSRNLKNDDFRKLLATRSVSHGTTSLSHTAKPSREVHSFTHKQVAAAAKKSTKKKFLPPKEKVVTEEESIFNESQAKLNEIMQRYRDRAAERRKGGLQNDADDMRAKITAAYKAVSDNYAATSAERRKMEIEESKYLGGDMEHTHLVKGLDYSLLNKVKGELEKNEEADELEQTYDETKTAVQKPETISENKMVKNICRLLMKNDPPPLRNEMFSRGRMAYVVELEDEESDVPSTLLRSVADCPNDQSTENINADNILINKLAQVLGYLRQDVKKRKRGANDTYAKEDLSRQKIYDDADDYASSSRTRGGEQQSQSRSNNDRREKTSYFDGSSSSRYGDDSRSRRDERGSRSSYFDSRDRGDRDRDRSEKTTVKRSSILISSVLPEPPKEEVLKKRRMEEEENDAYAELYPSGIGFLDAGGESDDEADFSKMDMGNRKGPIKRWDFDTEKEYESYQESREAMPKAAYQYGVKMNSGRKTRKTAAAGEKKLDRELDKINKILDERKKSGNAMDARY